MIDKFTWSVAGFAGAALVAISVWFIARDKPAAATAVAQRNPAAREDEHQAQLAALAFEVRLLRDVGTSREPPPHSTQPSPDPAASAAPHAASAEASPEEQQQLIEERTRQRLDALARGIEAEPRDAQWSEVAQRSLLDAYQGSEFDGAKFEATCRSTFCRLKADLRGARQPLVAARMLPLRGPWPAPSLINIDTESNQVEFYVAREDYELPRID